MKTLTEKIKDDVGLTQEEMETLIDLCKRSGLKPIAAKVPSTFDLTEVEMSGNLVIIRGWVTAFKKSSEVTKVYRKVS